MNANSQFFILPYSPERREEWDRFVSRSRNATFLLKRRYMDYHSDRFADRSLIISDKRGRIAALFAACHISDEEVSAHGGLTYGGLILGYSGPDGSDVVDILSQIASHYRRAGYRRLRYKAIPHIYHRYPCEDDIYAVFRCGGRLDECNLSSAVKLDDPIVFNENSRRNATRAARHGLTVSRDSDFASFWSILEGVLAERYGTKPVHTLDEITGLAKNFPENIHLYAVRNSEGKMVGGSVIFATDTCLHAQYIAASAEGKSSGALALLFQHLIDSHRGETRYFDFGISNESHGRVLNAGLHHQKFGFGGRGIAYNIYTIDL